MPTTKPTKPHRAGHKFRKCVICSREVRRMYGRYGDNAICETCSRLHNWRFNKIGGVYQEGKSEG